MRVRVCAPHGKLRQPASDASEAPRYWQGPPETGHSRATDQTSRYTRSPVSLCASTAFRPSFLRSIPEIAPRTAWAASRWPASVAGWLRPAGGAESSPARRVWCRGGPGCPAEVGDRRWCPSAGRHPAVRVAAVRWMRSPRQSERGRRRQAQSSLFAAVRSAPWLAHRRAGSQAG